MTIIQRLASSLRFARLDNWWFSKIPPLLAVAYLCVLVRPIPTSAALWSLICYVASIACVATFGHIVNDSFDVDADLRANKSNAMTDVSVGARTLLALLFAVAGFAPALAAGYSPGALALLAANYLWPTLYSIPVVRLKERGRLGVICDAMGSHVTPTLLCLTVFGLMRADASIALWMFSGLSTLWAAALGIKGILHHQIYDRANDIESGTMTIATAIEPAKIIGFLTWFNIVIELPISAALAATVFFVCPLAAVALAIYISIQALRYGLGERLTMVSEANISRAIVPFIDERFYTLWLPMAAALQLAIGRGELWWLPLLHAGAFYLNLSMERLELRSMVLLLLERWRQAPALVEKLPETTGRNEPRGESTAKLDDWTIVLFATAGLAAFVENALLGIRRCGIDTGIVQLVYPAGARDELGPLAARYRARSRILEETVDVRANDLPSRYVDWNTQPFNILMSYRFPVVRVILAEGKNLVVSDVDVAWLRNPLPYLSEVLRRFAWACQVEAEAEFPPNFCLGFHALRAAPETFELIDLNLTSMRARDIKPADQSLFRDILIDNPRFLAKIFALPESAFPSGLLYRSVPWDDGPVAMTGRMQPYIFHANWCVGLENKHRLLAYAEAWSTENRPRAGPLTRLSRAMLGAGRRRPAVPRSRNGADHVVELKTPGFHSYAVPASMPQITIISDPIRLPPDTRNLGAAITDIWIDGMPLPLSDARLILGFYSVESNAEHIWRWTDGAGVIALPFKGTDLHLEIKALFIASQMAAE